MRQESMVEVNEALTRKVADLARLSLSDQEVQLFTSQLGDILKYVDQLSEVSVAGVEPMTNPLDHPNLMRDDIVRASPRDAEGQPKVLTSAPDVIDGGYKVPPIL